MLGDTELACGWRNAGLCYNLADARGKAQEMNSEWWPAVSYREGARKAAREGAGAAIFVAAITGLFSVLAIFGVQILPGFSATGLVDAGLFAIVAWRVYRFSRAWAVVGLVLFVAERTFAFFTQGISASAGLIVGIFILLGFIHGVRGTFAYHKLTSEPSRSMDSP